MKKTILLSISASALLFAADSARLDSVTVTAASKTPQSLKNVTSNTQVITAQEMQERHFTTVAEALTSLVGTGAVQNGGVGTTTSLFVRGFDTKYTLVLIDGVRYNNLSSADGAAQFEHLLLSDIERIEVISGANPIWGADAAAGVVNIVTKKAARGLSGSAEATAGSYGTKSAAVTARYGGDGFDLSANVSRYLTDGFSAQAPKGYSGDEFEKDGYQNTNANLKAGYELAKNLRIDGEYFATHGVSNYDGYKAPNSVNRSKYDFEMHKAAITYEIASHRLSFQASRAETTREELDETSPYSVKLFEGVIKEYELKDSFDYAPFGNLTAGVTREDRQIGYTKPTKPQVQKDEEAKALFAANTNSFGSLVLTQALRHDDYSTFGSKTTGKIGAKYSFGDYSIASNYGSAFKTPTLTQMSNPWGASNFDLKPENIRSFDFTASYGRSSLTYFYSTVEDLINWQGSGYQNLDGRSLLQGYEAKTATNIGDNVVLNGSYTRLYTADSSGRELPRRAHDTINVTADWYATAALHIVVNGSYIGSRYDTNTQKFQTGYYALLGATVNYRVDKNLLLYVKADNLLDRLYQSVDGYATAGRSAYVGLKGSF